MTVRASFKGTTVPTRDVSFPWSNKSVADTSLKLSNRGFRAIVVFLEVRSSRQETSNAILIIFAMRPKRSAALPSIFLFVTALAQANQNPEDGRLWQREVDSGKGTFYDSSAPHPLSYFTSDPFLRDDGNDFCSDCRPEGKARVHLQHKFKTQLKFVGLIQKFAVYDLFYYFDDEIVSGNVGWKSILVRIGPHRFREIYHLQPTSADITSAYFIGKRPAAILATRDAIPGTGDQFYEAYWWFGRDGPLRIEAREVISKTLTSILPPGFGVWKGGGLSMTDLTFESAVWKEGDANCCPTGGHVSLKFRLDRGTLAVSDQRYSPSP